MKTEIPDFWDIRQCTLVYRFDISEQNAPSMFRKVHEESSKLPRNVGPYTTINIVSHPKRLDTSSATL
jgi:hypothetical protein